MKSLMGERICAPSFTVLLRRLFLGFIVNSLSDGMCFCMKVSFINTIHMCCLLDHYVPVQLCG
jgi:hypothetical protein